MCLRYIAGILCLTLSSYALATDDKGKEDVEFIPRAVTPVQDVVIHQPVVETKTPAMMEEVIETPTTLATRALEENIETARIFIELANSPDPEVKREFREHLKNSRGLLEEQRQALRSSLTSSGGKWDGHSESLDNRAGAAITQIDEALATAELSTHVYGMPLERFRALVEKNYEENMARLNKELEWCKSGSPLISVNGNKSLGECLVLLKLFLTQLNYFETHRKYLGEKRSIYTLMCPNEQEETKVALIMQDIIERIHKHQRVKWPDCFMDNYEHDQCKALLARIVKLFNLPEVEERFDQNAINQTVIVQTADARSVLMSQDAGVMPILIKKTVDDRPILMTTTRTTEELLVFKDRADRSREIARALKYDPMDDEFRAIYLADLEGVYNEMLADSWYQKNKEHAEKVLASPTLFSTSHIEASKQILGYEFVMRAVIKETREKLGRK